jgi:hypothetical protein
MRILERMVQEIAEGKMAELEALDKRYDAVESQLGFPPKKRYWSMSGAHSLNTLVIERQWQSMAAMETAYEQAFARPDMQALFAEGADIILTARIELYRPA